MKVPIKIKGYSLDKVINKLPKSLIYEGTNTTIGEKVLIKVYNKEIIKYKNDEILKINNEIFLLKLINHKNVLQIYEVIESPTFIFIILEYFNGVRLTDFIKSNGKTNQDKALQIYVQILSIISYIHEINICHLNLNPDIFFIDKDFNIKLCDFIYGEIYSKTNKITNYDEELTNKYSCPEIHVKKPYNPEQADIWSSGVVLYYVLFAELPFNAVNKYDLMKSILKADIDIPKNLPINWQIMLKCLIEVKESKRYKLKYIFMAPLFKEHLIYKQQIENGLITPINDDIISICHDNYGLDKEKLINDLKNNHFNQETSLYKQILNYFIENKIMNIDNKDHSTDPKEDADSNESLNTSINNNGNTNPAKNEKILKNVDTYLNKQKDFKKVCDKIEKSQQTILKSLDGIKSKYLMSKKKKQEVSRKVSNANQDNNPNTNTNNNNNIPASKKKTVTDMKAMLANKKILSSRRNTMSSLKESLKAFNSNFANKNFKRKDTKELKDAIVKKPTVEMINSRYANGKFKLKNVAKRKRRGSINEMWEPKSSGLKKFGFDLKNNNNNKVEIIEEEDENEKGISLNKITNQIAMMKIKSEIKKDNEALRENQTKQVMVANEKGEYMMVEESVIIQQEKEKEKERLRLKEIERKKEEERLKELERKKEEARKALFENMRQKQKKQKEQRKEIGDKMIEEGKKREEERIKEEEKKKEEEEKKEEMKNPNEILSENTKKEGGVENNENKENKLDIGNKENITNQENNLNTEKINIIQNTDNTKNIVNKDNIQSVQNAQNNENIQNIGNITENKENLKNNNVITAKNENKEGNNNLLNNNENQDSQVPETHVSKNIKKEPLSPIHEIINTSENENSSNDNENKEEDPFRSINNNPNKELKITFDENIYSDIDSARSNTRRNMENDKSKEEIINNPDDKINIIINDDKVIINKNKDLIKIENNDNQNNIMRQNLTKIPIDKINNLINNNKNIDAISISPIKIEDPNIINNLHKDDNFLLINPSSSKNTRNINNGNDNLENLLGSGNVRENKISNSNSINSEENEKRIDMIFDDEDSQSDICSCSYSQTENECEYNINLIRKSILSDNDKIEKEKKRLNKSWNCKHHRKLSLKVRNDNIRKKTVKSIKNIKHLEKLKKIKKAEKNNLKNKNSKKNSNKNINLQKEIEKINIPNNKNGLYTNINTINYKNKPNRKKSLNKVKNETKKNNNDSKTNNTTNNNSNMTRHKKSIIKTTINNRKPLTKFNTVSHLSKTNYKPNNNKKSNLLVKNQSNRNVMFKNKNYNSKVNENGILKNKNNFKTGNLRNDQRRKTEEFLSNLMKEHKNYPKNSLLYNDNNNNTQQNYSNTTTEVPTNMLFNNSEIYSPESIIKTNNNINVTFADESMNNLKQIDFNSPRIFDSTKANYAILINNENLDNKNLPNNNISNRNLMNNNSITKPSTQIPSINSSVQKLTSSDIISNNNYNFIITNSNCNMKGDTNLNSNILNQINPHTNNYNSIINSANSNIENLNQNNPQHIYNTEPNQINHNDNKNGINIINSNIYDTNNNNNNYNISMFNLFAKSLPENENDFNKDQNNSIFDSNKNNQKNNNYVKIIDTNSSININNKNNNNNINSETNDNYKDYRFGFFNGQFSSTDEHDYYGECTDKANDNIKTVQRRNSQTKRQKQKQKQKKTLNKTYIGNESFIRAFDKKYKPQLIPTNTMTNLNRISNNSNGDKKMMRNSTNNLLRRLEEFKKLYNEQKEEKNKNNFYKLFQNGTNCRSSLNNSIKSNKNRSVSKDRRSISKNKNNKNNSILATSPIYNNINYGIIQKKLIKKDNIKKNDKKERYEENDSNDENNRNYTDNGEININMCINVNDEDLVNINNDDLIRKTSNNEITDFSNKQINDDKNDNSSILDTSNMNNSEHSKKMVEYKNDAMAIKNKLKRQLMNITSSLKNERNIEDLRIFNGPVDLSLISLKKNIKESYIELRNIFKKKGYELIQDKDEELLYQKNGRIYAGEIVKVKKNLLYYLIKERK